MVEYYNRVKSDGEALNGFEFEMYFNADFSYFPIPDAFDYGGMFEGSYVSLDAGFEDVVYGENKDRVIYVKQDLDGKIILEKRTSKSMSWKISKESKTIDKYKVYKAQSKNDYRGVITAWFAPEIPYGYGPTDIFGLPGLILEAHVDDGGSRYSYFYKSIKDDTKNRTISIPDFPVWSSKEVDDFYSKSYKPFVDELIKKQKEAQSKSK